MGTSSDVVCPGQLTDISPDSELGGVVPAERGVVAMVWNPASEDGAWSVRIEPRVNSLEVGDDFIGEVHGLQKSL